MAAMIVPPGGLVGFANMTPASRAALFPGGRSGSARSSRTRRRSSKRAKSASSSGKRRRTRKPKFGSPAWRKMYNLGKKRK